MKSGYYRRSDGNVERMTYYQVDGQYHTRHGVPLYPTENIEKLMGWSHSIVREYSTDPDDNGGRYLIPQTGGSAVDTQTINYVDVGNDMIRIEYGGHTYTLNPDDMTPVSADDDGSAIFDPRCIGELKMDAIEKQRQKNQQYCRKIIRINTNYIDAYFTAVNDGISEEEFEAAWLRYINECGEDL